MQIWPYGTVKHHTKWVPFHRTAPSRVAVIEDFGQQSRGADGHVQHHLRVRWKANKLSP